MKPTLKKTAPSTYALSRWLFLRLLALIYFTAFLSLSTQILGLIGSQGIIPAISYLNKVSTFEIAGFGVEKFFFHPTLAWLNCSDFFLFTMCMAGVLVSIILFFGFLPRVNLLILWILYLSLANVSQQFMSHPWEGLLLETGFLAIFFAPSQKYPKKPMEEENASRVFLYLLLWLLFRLMFASTWTKLVQPNSGWKHLTSLDYHYETQPLPTWIGWYAQQLPIWVQKACLAGTLAIEPLAPFFIFLWRNLRLKSFLAITALQFLLILIGNYSFLNWLTFALCILLLDDQTLLKFVPSFFKSKGDQPPPFPMPKQSLHKRIQAHSVPAVIFVVIVVVSGYRMVELITGKSQIPGPLRTISSTADSFHIVNRYGLFAISKSSRQEIIIEGSNDGKLWLPYEFKWKPGNLQTPPHFVAPHQPRLDWQMWYATFSTYSHTPWFQGFMLRLLQGSPEVLDLLKSAPFSTPPKFVRATLYNYRFTDIPTRNLWGTWWARTYERPYSPVLSLESFVGFQP